MTDADWNDLQPEAWGQAGALPHKCVGVSDRRAHQASTSLIDSAKEECSVGAPHSSHSHLGPPDHCANQLI